MISFFIQTSDKFLVSHFSCKITIPDNLKVSIDLLYKISYISLCYLYFKFLKTWFCLCLDALSVFLVYLNIEISDMITFNSLWDIKMSAKSISANCLNKILLILFYRIFRSPVILTPTTLPIRISSKVFLKMRTLVISDTSGSSLMVF